MAKVRSFTVLPSLPEKLKDLKTVAKNMFWSWNSEYVELFRRIDPGLWETCGHNPVKILGCVPQSRLEELADNDGFVYQLERAVEKLEEDKVHTTWYDKVYAKKTKPLIAYFSAEFGIHESIPIYSGGLGILAGDHLKSASDLGVPLIGVGLCYQDGYFRQYLNADGWQQERYQENDFYNMAIEMIRDSNGHPMTISVQFPQRSVKLYIWKAQIGKVDLYLLDSNVPSNRPEDREITSKLYGGDNEMRIKQEIILGIGGYKGLVKMGLEPTVCHMNEGHAAFLALERIRELRNAKQMTFDEAAETTKAANVFTVHTPVAAGCDEFSPDLMDKYFGGYFPKIGLNRNQFLALGRFDESNDAESFKMPVLAIKLSDYRNGVSELHGEVSREMWKALWPELPVDEVPIKSVTNGIHVKSWLSSELDSLYDRYLGSNWCEEMVDKSTWARLDQVPDEELWRIHQRGKELLISFARNRLKTQMAKRGASRNEILKADEVLDPEALTIGFARRFATYKRGNLLMRDLDRLKAILNNTDKPVQIVFAGKAHPRDDQGKDIIKQIVHFASDDALRRRIIFLEDYDIDVARYMVQGVDVWLNNPRRPLEASGTSGMKAAVNGVLNLSTFDGWWCEGYVSEGGWVIGAGETYKDVAYGDKVEAEALYNLIENEVVPLYYDRSFDRLPRGWIRWMKNCIKNCTPMFNTHRMVGEYVRKFYNPAAARWRYLTASAMSRARALSMWKSNIRNVWPELAIHDVDVKVEDIKAQELFDSHDPQLEVGNDLSVKASVKLGQLTPEEVSVQIYYGQVDSWGNIRDGKTVQMEFEGKGDDQGNQTCIFTGRVPCKISGQHGFSVRVLPKHPDMVDQYEPGLILWEKL